MNDKYVLIDPMLPTKVAQISNTLAFFRSVINSGESWTHTCDQEYIKAKATLQSLYKAAQSCDREPYKGLLEEERMLYITGFIDGLAQTKTDEV